MKNIGIGCGFYVLLAIATSLILRDEDRSAMTIGLAFFCSIPLFIATYFVEKCARYKWAIWSAGWALCIALSFVIPYEKTAKADKTGEAKKTEKTAKTAAKSGDRKKLSSDPGKPAVQPRRTLEEALAAAEEVGYPVIVRPAYTLGGSGGGR